MVISVKSSSTSKTDFICFFFCVFGVGGFTDLIRGRVLTIFSWAFYNFLSFVISINIVLALVASFPTYLVSLNPESVCRSCVGLGAVLPLGGDVKILLPLLGWYYRLERYYRGYFRGYFRSGPKTRHNSNGGRHGCNFFSTARKQ